MGPTVLDRIRGGQQAEGRGTSTDKHTTTAHAHCAPPDSKPWAASSAELSGPMEPRLSCTQRRRNRATRREQDTLRLPGWSLYNEPQLTRLWWRQEKLTLQEDRGFAPQGGFNKPNTHPHRSPNTNPTKYTPQNTALNTSTI